MWEIRSCSLQPGNIELKIQRYIVPIHRDIHVGEEISDSYGVGFIVNPKKIRQKKLLSQYRFICECSACKDDYPQFLNLNKHLPDVLANCVDTSLNKINDSLRKADVTNAKQSTLQLLNLLNHNGLPYLHAVNQRCRVLLSTCFQIEHCTK